MKWENEINSCKGANPHWMFAEKNEFTAIFTSYYA